MVKAADVLAGLPVRNQEVLVVQDQDERDIIDEILVVHNEFAGDYDTICKYFDQGDINETSEYIWDFLKKNLPYEAETIHDQTVRSPYRILQSGSRVDCKHFSLFSAGILDALKRKKGGTWDWCYRFASYNWEPVAAHVFVVVFTDKGEVWIDPVLDAFNEDKLPTWEIDKKPMALYKLSGPNEGTAIVFPAASQVQVVDKKAAERNFFIWVELNLFSFKELMKRYPEVVYGPVKAYFEKMGFSFSTLMLLLKNG